MTQTSLIVPLQRPILFYDGGCPLCRREIAHYRRLDRTGRVEWVDIHTSGDRLGRYGITWETAMRRLHLIEVDGRRFTGAYAFAALWRRLPYYRVLGWMLIRTGLVQPLDKVYVRFADWRWSRRRAVSCACDTPTTVVPRRRSDAPESESANAHR